MKLALFDLDHTLLPLDSDHNWATYCIAKGVISAKDHQARSDAFYQDYCSGTLDIYAYTSFATEVLVGKSQAQLRELHAGYMDEIIEPALSTQAIELVQGYRENGWQTLLVTATNEFVTAPIARALGFEHLIAVELLRTSAGAWLNQVRGIPSLQYGKVERVTGWLAARGLSWSDLDDSVMYSDSINDVPLMERTHKAVATNPDAKLRALAAQKGWQILDLFV